MSVQQIGTRLVRNFGNGDKLRTVISEVVDVAGFRNPNEVLVES